ncbi:MAG: hypothetical protein HKL80_05760 [Acidimicrobiales bacterium]|nr:hypothetical protein [Acidimicrobiales bacterium]
MNFSDGNSEPGDRALSISDLSRPGPKVYISNDNGKTSGMATMIGELLEANIDSFATRRVVASLLKGGVVLKASDRAQIITIEFDGKSITVRDGQNPDYPTLEGGWLTFAAVASGRKSPLHAIRAREISLKSPKFKMGDSIAAGGVGFVMSVPKSFYETVNWSKRIIYLSIALVAASLVGYAFYSLRRNKMHHKA